MLNNGMSLLLDCWVDEVWWNKAVVGQFGFSSYFTFLSLLTLSSLCRCVRYLILANGSRLLLNLTLDVDGG